MDYDVIIAGGGPAGLSAAVVLGRCRRRVLLCDTGAPRNARSLGIHGYLTRDGMAPRAFLEAGREEAEGLGVEMRKVAVTDAQRLEGGFEVTLDRAFVATCRMLLLATGVTDDLPKVPGAEALYGTSLWHCPYCDGWEARDRPLAAYGRGRHGAALALGLRTWSGDVALLSDGPAGLDAEQLARLQRNAVVLDERKIARFEGRNGLLDRVVFRDGTSLPRFGVFFEAGKRKRSALARKLGCRFHRGGSVVTDRFGRTACDDLYVAGDLSHDSQFVVVAAAEGLKAGVAINKALQAEERR